MAVLIAVLAALVSFGMPADSQAASWDSLMHNSGNLGTKYWTTTGWGLPGTKYGPITCDTCHTPAATNIKGVKSTIQVPNGTDTWPNGFSTVAVNFSITTINDSNPNVIYSMGWDTTGRTTSTRVCEVCHSQTKYHRYNVVGQPGGLTHNNGADCTTSCHPHNQGFRVAGGACDSCHGNPPTTPTAGGTTGYVSPSIGAMSTWVTAGHGKHIQRGMGCEVCHDGSQMVENSDTGSNYRIEIGFNANPANFTGFYGTVNSGTFKGYTSLSGNVWYPGNAGTTISTVSSYAQANKCSNLYCHGSTLSGGSITEPTWSTTIGTQAVCGSCHGVSTAAPGLGSHVQHAGSAATYGGAEISCDTCHPRPLYTDAAHVNGRAKWSLNTANPKVGTQAKYWTSADGMTGYMAGINPNFGTCATVYCHSDVQNTTGTAGPQTFASPVWGSIGSVWSWGSDGQDSCSVRCHNTKGPATTLASGMHAKHITSTTYNMACANCHTAAGAGTNKHTDFKIDVAMSAAYGGSYSQGAWNTPGNGFGSCTVTYCHSQGTSVNIPFTLPNVAADWKSTLGTTCTGCHNNDANSNKWMTTGSHLRHIDPAGLDTALVDCSNCHNSTVTDSRNISGFSNHTDRHIDIQFKGWNTAGTFNGKNTWATLAWSTPGANANACTNLYCHSSAQGTDGVGAPTYGIAIWTSTGSVSLWSSTGNKTCVNTCHNTASGASALTSGSHLKHIWTSYQNYACDSCHTGSGPWNTNHVNHAIEVRLAQNYGGSYSQGLSSLPQNGFGTCVSTYCHGNTATLPVWGSSGSVLCGSCHENNNSLAGQHSKHYATATQATNRLAANNSTTTTYVYNCGTCHYTEPHATGSWTTLGRQANVDLSSTIAGGGSYTDGSVVNVDPPNNFRWTNGTCRGTYCHSGGGNQPPSWTSFNWATTNGVGAAGCYMCHEFNVTGHWLTTGRHPRHMQGPITSGTYNYTCATCHNSVTKDSATIADKTKHVAGSTTLAFDTISGAGTWATSSKTCTATYCHSQGTNVNDGQFAAPNRVAVWTTIFSSSTAIRCTSCHGNDALSGSWMTSGSHYRHIDPTGLDETLIDCSNCHNSTVSDSRTITTVANHVNKRADIKFKGWNTTGTFNGVNTWTSYVWSTPGANANACANLYCHSSAQGLNGLSGPIYAAAIWTSSGSVTQWSSEGNYTCSNSCHATVWSSSGSHLKHVAPAGTGNEFSCKICHQDRGAWTTNHANRLIDVNIDQTYASGGGGSYSQGSAALSVPQNGFGECSNISCHGTSVPFWGSSGSAGQTCGGCHAVNNTLAGKHGMHWADAANGPDRQAVNDSTSTLYKFRCGVCHYGALHSGGWVTFSQTAEVYFDPNISKGGSYRRATQWYTDNKYVWTPGTCSSTYCHSQGGQSIGNPSWVTFDWSTVKGIDTSTTQKCYMCHEYKVSGHWMTTGKHWVHSNRYGKTCATCHNDTTKDDTTIADKTKHVVGTVNLSFDTIAGRSGTWETSSKACSNIYCHSQGTNVNSPYSTPNVIGVTWTTSLSTTCTGCHNNDYASGKWMTSGSHAKHVDTAGLDLQAVDCNMCHGATVSNSRTISTLANHANYQVNIKFMSWNTAGQFNGVNTWSSYVWSTPGANTNACSNLYCHSDPQGDDGVAAPIFGTAIWTSPGSVTYWASSGNYSCANVCHATTWSSSGSHLRHASPVGNNYSCTICHSGRGAWSTYHANSKIDINFSSPATGGSYSQGASHAVRNGFGFCASVSCHGTARPVWGSSGSNPCGSCHVNNSQLAGKHNKHWATTWGATNRLASNDSTPSTFMFRCGVCHYNAQHAFGNVSDGQTAQVNFDPTIAKGGTYSPASNWFTDIGATYAYTWTPGNCASTYCHSQGGQNPIPSWTSFNWSTVSGINVNTVQKCYMCHEYDGTDGHWMTTGKHSTHVNRSGRPCLTCHNATTKGWATITDKTKHASGYPNLQFEATIAPAGTYSTSTKSCSTVYCHSQGTNVNSPFTTPNITGITWTTTFPADCTGCHNNDAVSGRWMSSGSHLRHIDPNGLDLAAIDCSSCHNSTVSTSRTISTAANHSNRVIDIQFKSWNTTGTFNGKNTWTSYAWSTPGANANACGNLYCHSDPQGNDGYAAPIFGTAIWTSPGSVTFWSSVGNYSCANVCHATTWSSSGSHLRHASPTGNNYSCTVCHQGRGAWSTYHANRLIDVNFSGPASGGSYSQQSAALSVPRNGFGFCANVSCHGAGVPVWGSSGTNQCGNCHAVNSQLAGKHGAHWATTGKAPDRQAANDSTPSTFMYRCGVCHYNAQHAFGWVTFRQTAEVVFDPTFARGGSYREGGVWYTDGTYTYTPGTCSSTYCHSQGGQFIGNPSWVTFNWNTVVGINTQTVQKCYMCHDYDGTDGHWMTTGKHSTHVNRSGRPCLTCHNATTTGWATITDKTKHAAGSPTLKFEPILAPAGTYTTSTKTCGTVYCHSQGTNVNSPFTTPNITGITWTTTFPANCTGCHGGDYASGLWMSTGSHLRHVDTSGIDTSVADCNTCHAATVSNSRTIIPTTGSANHSNRQVNIKFAEWMSTGQFNGVNTWSSYVWSTPGANVNACGNLYCHSTGQGLNGVSAPTYGTAIWTSAGSVNYWSSQAGNTCANVCHGTAYTNTPLASGSHAKHVGAWGSASIGCGKCHNGAGSWTTFHASRTIELSFVDGGSYSQGASSAMQNGFGTCRSTYCHGAPKAVTGIWATFPVWGSSGSVACGSCHENNNTLAGQHPVHYASAIQAVDRTAANYSTVGYYRFNCGTCHYIEPHAQGPWGSVGGRVANIDLSSSIAGGGSYVEGTVVGVDTNSFSWTRGTCRATYCHSGGIDASAATNWSSFNWATSNGVGAGTCYMCHKYGGPSAGTQWITTGKHPKHVNTYQYNTFVSNCSSCHAATTSGWRTISDKSKHANGVKDIVFSSWANLGGTYNDPTHRCSNVYCHSQGRSVSTGQVIGIDITWNTVATCSSCHGASSSGRPDYANYTSINGILKANSHQGGTHKAEACGSCHNTTTLNGTTITSFSRHVNKAYDLGWRTSQKNNVWFSYAYSNNGGTCMWSSSGLSTGCHASTTPQYAKWGSVGSTNFSCNGCHQATQQKTVFGAGGGRNRSGWLTLTIRNAVADFSLASRHVMGGTVTKWDCVVCHAEATTGGSPDATYHKNGPISLRNVDTGAFGWEVDNRGWDTFDYKNLDDFCLACHDADGAAGIAVNTTNSGVTTTPGTKALKPFNTSDQVNSGSGWGSMLRASTSQPDDGFPSLPVGRPRVVNVKDQFYPGTNGAGATYNGNPSQHAVLGQRYSYAWTSWLANAWVTNLRLKKWGKDLGVDREASMLSCADCHVLDSGGGAHGAANKYFIWTTDMGAACMTCHRSAVYNNGAAGTGSRWPHTYSRGGDQTFGIASAGSLTGPECLNCHASWNMGTTVSRMYSYGGIHGSWSSTAWYTVGTTNVRYDAYRFFPGVWRRSGSSTAGNAFWGSMATWNCYFVPADDNGFSACSSHQGTTSAGTYTPRYMRPTRY